MSLVRYDGAGWRASVAIMLKDARLARGVTRNVLADFLGKSRRSIDRIENAECDPSAETVDRWLRFCGWSATIIAGRRRELESFTTAPGASFREAS